MRLTALLACALEAAAATAFAQTTEATKRWETVNLAFPPPSAEAVKAAIAVAQSDCPSAAPVLGPIEPATAWSTIDEAVATGQLVNAWSVTISRPECPPNQAWARYLLLRDNGDGLTAQLLHPGRSYVDLYNLTDGVMTRAMRTAANTAARDIPGCSSAWISSSGRLIRTDIVDDSKVGPNRYGLRHGEWRESWLFGVCGRQLSVFVDFTGGPHGVTATASSWASLKR